MHDRMIPTRPDRLWTLLGIALVLAVVVTACDGKTPIGPTQTETRTSGSTSIQYPPAIPATGGKTNIEGVYQLTVTASPRCSLPEEVRQRTYTATLAETTPGYVTVSLSGAEFVLQEWNEAGFEGIRDGDTLRFVVNNGYGPGYWLIELIDETKFLNIEGVALATIRDNTIEGTFAAELHYFVPGQRTLGDCDAIDHRITFVR